MVWEWACPPSGTVFHVMLGDIRKHVFLRQWGWCEGWIILQVLSECVAWSVCALCQEVFLVRRYESAIIVYFQVGSARNCGFFLIKFFTLSYFSWSRFVHVSDALRLLYVRLFHFRRQWWVHPTSFFGEPRGEVISGSSLWDCFQVEFFKCRCFSRSVCRTSCSSVQAHQRVVIAAQFVGLRLGNVLGKLSYVSPRFCRSWRRCFSTTTDHA